MLQAGAQRTIDGKPRVPAEFRRPLPGATRVTEDDARR